MTVPPPETLTFEDDQTSAQAGNVVVILQGVTVFSSAPANYTTILIELRVESPSAGPINRMKVTAASNSEIIAESDQPNERGIYSISLTPTEYPSGDLSVSYFPADGSASVANHIVLKVTTFYADPPAGFSAFA